MRDPKRISKLLALIQKGWEGCPDLRFCQIIENLRMFMKKDDIFYVEDDVFEEAVIEFFKLKTK